MGRRLQATRSFGGIRSSENGVGTANVLFQTSSHNITGPTFVGPRHADANPSNLPPAARAQDHSVARLTVGKQKE